MAIQKYSNNFSTLLAQNAAAGSVQLFLDDVSGLPDISGGNFCILTLKRLSDGLREVVKVTAIDVPSKSVSVVRGQELSTPLAFVVADEVQLRLTAGGIGFVTDEVARLEDAETGLLAAETNAAASAAAALVSEGNSSTSADESAASAAAALVSENNAATSESNASASETAAGVSETNAAASAAAALVSETNAGLSEDAALVSETNAAASEAAAASIVAGTAPERHSVRPSLLLDFANSKKIDPRITFSRASTARYWDGKTKIKGEENLLTYSQEFDNAAWVKSSATIAANNTAAPDGTITADRITFGAAGTGNSVSQVVSVDSGTDAVYSIYLKGTAAETVDLELGDLSSTIVTFTGSWQREVVSGANAATAVRVISGTGRTATVFHVWGAQLEKRDTLTDYLPTTSAALVRYQPVLQTAAIDAARFDHDLATSESKGLLIEEARTNLLTYSSEFDNAAWTKTRSSITPDIFVAPDGLVAADKFVEDSSLNTHEITESTSVTSGTTYQYTVYAKPAERSEIRLQFSTTGFGANVATDFDLTNGILFERVTGTNSASSMEAVGNGWYRCTLQSDATSTVASTSPQMMLSSGLQVSYQGDGYSGLYIWGAQFEAGISATSYIPTSGATATRSADAASVTGEGQLGYGALYIEAYAATGSSIVNLGDTSVIAPDTSNHKIATSYDPTSTDASSDGGTIANSAGSVGGADLGILEGGTGHIRKLSNYPIRLTDTELQSITEA